ncbi:uncharacterized protein LOC131680197 [Topomyia yanbarensis]|uniref:uncharacterized protein LOC131680197 n=1 Tax=Topomyia yanbarensis TaxID=2498891 RepID=UPI00273B961A|nr:uncharacterized protein LOC131680197 [Topomyia yanbarensis]
MTFLEENNHLDQRQFAFRKGAGTGSHLGAFGEILRQALANDQHADIAILDIVKAYNTVSREEVLRQLANWGVTGNLGSFIKDYLHDRTFRVGIGGQQSRIFTEENGVPQGSVLAVSLFLVSMNSLFATLPEGVHIFVYADDIITVVVGKSTTRVRIKLQAAVNAVSRWTETVGFNLAAAKCSIAHCCNLHHVATSRPVKLNGTLIPFRREPKVLGITLDRRLTFMPHFRSLKRDCESRKRLIRTISYRHPTWNRKTALNVGGALIHSKIYYGLEITSHNWDGFMTVLAPLYNSTIRLASNLLPSTPAEAACVEAGMLPFRWAAANIMIRCALRYLERTSGNDCSLLQSAQNIFREYTGTELPQLARLHRIRDRSWYESRPCTNTSLSRSLGAGPSPEVARAKFHQLMKDRFTNHARIFTDASKLVDRVGVGVRGIDTGLAFRLPPICSVFSAEAAAISLALANKTDGIPTVILSDSLSVITALETGTSRHPYIQAIENYCDSLTTICWVPGHCGISGNEEADALAARGRRTVKLLTKLVPSSDIVTEFRRKTREHFTTHWRNQYGHPQEVNGELACWIDRPTRLEQRALSRLRTGHTKITHEHTITRVDPHVCPICQIRLTVEHLLVNCPEFANLRILHRLPLSIRDILANDPVSEDTLISFLRDARLLERI